MTGKLRQKWWIIGLALLLLIGSLPFVINYRVLSQGHRRAITSVEEAPSAQTAIVLGAGVYPGGQVSPILKDRLDTGIQLYRTGKVKKMLLTGDHGQKQYDEVNAMRAYVLEQGIPPADVFLDHAGFDTLDSIYRAREIFAVRDAIVVTQEFHLARALYMTQELGLKASGVIADRQPYANMEYIKAREFLARNKAFIQLNILHSGPKFLGPAIPIDGDGRQTWDKV
ncbi:MAG TPA: ElyC/SanA/YdcF family protein [Bacillota bacterium]|nr:ElyC/SanA/YdcF family protein [Bacillota bacterium]